MLRRLGALGLPGREPWGRSAACHGHHPFIGLCDTGRAHSARLKRDVHLQGSAAERCSTSHVGLLPPVALGSPGSAAAGAVPPGTHPHSWGAVVSVEYSSRTLTECLQHCRKCTDSALRRPLPRRPHLALFHHASLKKLLDESQDVAVGKLARHQVEDQLMRDAVKGFDNLLPLSTTHSMTR
jgi:hypothetical protein